MSTESATEDEVPEDSEYYFGHLVKVPVETIPVNATKFEYGDYIISAT
jgi:hypothetical protein